jgi:hypothetical protein
VVAPATWHKHLSSEGRRVQRCQSPLPAKQLRIFSNLPEIQNSFLSPASSLALPCFVNLSINSTSIFPRASTALASPLALCEKRVQARQQKTVTPHLFARNQLGQAAPKPRLARQDKTSHASPLATLSSSQLQLQHCISDLSDTTIPVLLPPSSLIHFHISSPG